MGNILGGWGRVLGKNRPQFCLNITAGEGRGGGGQSGPSLH